MYNFVVDVFIVCVEIWSGIIGVDFIGGTIRVWHETVLLCSFDGWTSMIFVLAVFVYMVDILRLKFPQ